MSLVQQPWQLFLLRTFQGAVSGTVAAATVLTANISPVSQVAFTLGLLTTGVAVGNALGPTLGGVLSDFLGYRIAFLSTAFCLIAAGVVVTLGVHDDKDYTKLKAAQKSAAREAGASKKHEGTFRSLFGDFRSIAHSPVLITILIVAFTNQAANTIAEPMMALFVQQLQIGSGAGDKFTGSATGIVLGVGAAATALAAIIVGKYANRMGYWRALIICLGFGALFRIPQALVANVPQLLIFRALASFFMGGAGPVLNAIIATTAEKGRQGTVYGLQSSLGSAGGALGPVLGSAVAMINLRAVFIATATVLGLSTALVARRSREVRRKK
jgi:DHA1 family multidrug resistance protein-like MFS transporter